MYYEKPLPFYMTYPYADMYDQEWMLEQEMEKMKSYYPKNAAMVQKFVEDACDKIEYEGSMIDDEYPDRFMMNQMCDHIYSQVKEENARLEMMELEKIQKEEEKVIPIELPERLRRELEREKAPGEDNMYEENKMYEEDKMPGEDPEEEMTGDPGYDQEKIKKIEKDMAEKMQTQEISDRALRELVQVLFFNEVYRRRCRRRRCRRYF